MLPIVVEIRTIAPVIVEKTTDKNLRRSTNAV